MYCQKCRTPLKLDGSLTDLNPAAFDLLVASASQQQPARSSSKATYPHDAQRRALYDQVAQNAAPATLKRRPSARRSDAHSRAHPRPGDHSAMSFVLLTDSQLAPPRLTTPASDVAAGTPSPSSPGGASNSSGTQRRISSSSAVPQRLDSRPSGQPHETERITKLFEILSARSDIDHPICVECTDMLVDGLQKRLDSAARERDAYAGFLKQVQADIPTEEDIAESEKALSQARQEEKDAMDELLKLEQEKAALDREIAGLENESRQLDADENAFWQERNAFTAKLSEFQKERDSINSSFDHDSQLLTKLQRANVYNDTFSIHHDGNFATINGLRLGRSSAKPVDWPEINAAWGQALLLVVTVADKLGYRFEAYDPLPMGSTSKIIAYEQPSPSSSRLGAHRSGPPPAPKKHVLELYSSGDITSHLPWNRKFDRGMIAFLELLRQLGAFVHRQTRETQGATPLALPYRIEADKIGDDRIGHFSIKLGIGGSEESWTKACKFALTCCKFLIAHTSNVSSQQAGNNAR